MDAGLTRTETTTSKHHDATSRALTATAWAGIALATLALAVPAALALAGSKTMIVTGGSMSPAIDAGDAALVRDTTPERLAVGDVITFTAVGTRRTTTHRIVALKSIGGRLYAQTRGDANPTPDANLASADSVVGEVAHVMPFAGRFLHVATNRAGRVLLLAVPALALMTSQGLAFRRQRPRRGSVREFPKQSKTAEGGRRSGVASLLLSLVLAVVALASASAATGAVFTDTASAGGNTFTTAATFP